MLKENTENKHFIFDHPRQINAKFILKYIFVMVQNIFYKTVFSLIKKKHRRKKYHVTICAIFKNEGPYLREWIEYHLIVGVEHFYLYNNNSSDNYFEILKPYIDEGTVTLIDFPYQHAQNKAYGNCIKQFREETEWIGFIDIDEFVVPVSDNDIYSFLKKFLNRPAVKIYWKLFGTSGFLKRNVENLVTQDFIISWPKYDEVGKCFYNTLFDVNTKSQKMNVMHHSFWGKWHGIELPPVNCFNKISQRGFENVKADVFPIQINHYFSKSYDEYFRIKAPRGDVYFKKNVHKLPSYFYRHELLCTQADYKIFKYLIKLKLAMKKIE